MNVHHWFPTTVYCNTLPLAAERLQALAAVVRALPRPASRHGLVSGDGWSTYRHGDQLLAHPELDDLRALLVEEIRDYTEALECRLGGGRLAIANSWANVYPAGSSVALHDHGGAMLSGAFYLQASPGAGHIYFQNPLLDLCKGSKPLPFAEVQPVEVRAGELVLFPGWLKHRTDDNRGPADKVVLSFNVVWVRSDARLLPVCEEQPS